MNASRYDRGGLTSYILNALPAQATMPITTIIIFVRLDIVMRERPYT